MEIIVFDLEFTAWEGSLERHWTGPNEFREIVEIGAVRTNTQNTAAADQFFSMLVKPRKNPILSEYFVNLTGITQKKLDEEGVEFAGAIDAFAKFAAGASGFYAYGEDGDIVAENCGFQGLANPLNGSPVHNVRTPLSKAYSLKRDVTSADLPTATGLTENSGTLRPHKALDDARAVAHVLVPLLKSTSFSL